MNQLIKTGILSITALLFLGNASCSKKDETCTAVIRVVRASGALVSGAKVKLTSNEAVSNSGGGELADYLPATKLTDGSGTVTFVFKYPAILDVEVSHVSFGSSSDLIKLEVGESVSKTITLQ